MNKRITTNDLAIIIKSGFDAQDERFAKQDERIAKQDNKLDLFEFKLDNLAKTIKVGFEKQGKKIDSLKYEVAKNGDAVAHLINRFELESAANQSAHKRIEGRLDHVDQRLNRIEHRLDFDPLPLPA